jgi:tRNA nucleotidyltransferase (CCA-adding enzyme)
LLNDAQTTVCTAQLAEDENAFLLITGAYGYSRNATVDIRRHDARSARDETDLLPHVSLTFGHTMGAAPVREMTRWEHFPHDADIGVRGFGATAVQAFEQAAQALTAVVTHAEVRPQVAVQVSCEAPDIELLFVEWLNAIIYEMAVRTMLFGRFAVQIEGASLEGTLWGEPVDIDRHAPACEPKGATYTALKVAQGSDGTWSAACVVDV